MQYIIYMDESNDEGPYYGNFYGGALVRSQDYMRIVDILEAKKQELNITGEIKWQKVTSPYVEKYIALMDCFFDLIQEDLVKIRIMFTHNYRQATSLSKEQLTNEYQMLYYQFFKHAFGLKYSNPEGEENLSLRIYFDELPVSPQVASVFKDFIQRLQFTQEFLVAGIQIRKEDISEVKSHQHVILQYMDIVLGSMYFRLNELHKVIPEGERKRGKRTIAKERVYKHINNRIRRIYPNFNIGISTGTKEYEERWRHPYRHWLFIPSEHRIAPQFAKKNR
ncbi:MAG TPA: DUF3800 domain-containing protein [Paenibacillus sp.]|uniref:DUF3800 domain-containing protein n=1 Tax=Paenibacillus sp. TaxID=58172 RepID=UPI0028D1EA71|nr:DUF3800 domain-containing protein [Paenibacillus sp.]HUC92719.1 DUF3800 domain-containing protein [Paenibacillus sp.]